MTIKLSKFGEMLISRPAGREAYFSAKAYLLGKNPGMVEFDFDKIKVLTPSWIDEFIALLKNDFPKTKIKFLHSHNPTVISSLKIISASPSA
ncbi:hypothetical protein A3J20_03500 [Candidatus Gottesmanbacteria bacterium RIFCSPLOWO2_02_FULL_42_29]|uniref:DUF4325 domain-containing protein n=2 Tax=Candidatus Gottesmaniibacteriota TaxID=1752720 RepID=A0A1F6BDR2_9BACT|nr:MAG: hypothetical protein UV09_C0002G0066 [Candidatus Gottesmanbacteria bacterium GW2011_GWA2_42_18]KKS73406.1 MAG: hypothetical protein UV46_C0075G0004 [Candidatus Gottesmanbacteria bacterium GW2011_GWC2_42_8]OGG12240.1 MAG: hypothetical protein A2781_04980 [Candidatus Gottesmanbacteria bacterium RIFCSPHIGHO2_01_FULL_42_27]OGG21728.1 MAG: hypothetical protein A3E72_04645 [Candidatus Gottesmanbacteria bacterium RIFCSPHIGHO2_12_FULL_43_26]OGG34727.1 MAG: hypothetical protein A3G68_01670 [Cand